MRMYLIRHGMTAGNLEKRYVGRTDEPLLESSAAELGKKREQYPAVQYVITSPMRRCQETAAALFPEIAAEAADGLQECDFGSFEYKNYLELSGNEEYQRWIDSGGRLPFPGGESQSSFCERSQEAFLEGCRRAFGEDAEDVAFVVHGGTIMAVMEAFCTTEKPYFSWQVGNGCGFAVWADPEALSAGQRFLKLERELPDG